MTPFQGSLFRATDPDTSVSADPRPNGCAGEMLDLLDHAQHGFTADEFAARLPHREKATVAGVCSRLLCDTGDRRLTRRNREAIVWAGHAWVLSSTEKVCARCGAVEQYQPSSFAGVTL